MRTTTLAGIALAISAIAGCSSDPPATAPPARPVTSVTASPTPTKLASPADYADAVSQFAGDLRSHAADMDGCEAVNQCAFDAVLTRAAVGIAKEQLDLVLAGSGAPPPELESLVADTRTAIDKAVVALDPIKYQNDDPSAAIAAMDALAALMDRWAPYGV